MEHRATLCHQSKLIAAVGFFCRAKFRPIAKRTKATAGEFKAIRTQKYISRCLLRVFHDVFLRCSYIVAVFVVVIVSWPNRNFNGAFVFICYIVIFASFVFFCSFPEKVLLCGDKIVRRKNNFIRTHLMIHRLPKQIVLNAKPLKIVWLIRCKSKHCDASYCSILDFLTAFIISVKFVVEIGFVFGFFFAWQIREIFEL